MKIAILGWGSLLWDKQEKFKEFNEKIGVWNYDGPSLPLEFSRVSETRGKALTLVIDRGNGTLCKVAYALSKRENSDDAICDLRCREGTIIKNIGCYYLVDKSRNHSRNDLSKISEWAKKKNIDVVIWTDLESNFKDKIGEPFSIQSALLHIQKLNPEDKVKAAEYVWRAPDFIDTPLRKTLQLQPWFPG